MTSTARGERARRPGPPFDGLSQDEDDLEFLGGLAERRGYVERGDGRVWLEWSDTRTPPPSDPDVAAALRQLSPFTPFAYPALRAFPDGTVTPSVPEPTFLGAAHGSARGAPAGGPVADHIRYLISRLDFDVESRQAHPDNLLWLTAYRDALALELRRCAARLEPPPRRPGAGGAPVPGALAVLRVWLAEAAAAQGGLGRPGAPDLAFVAVAAWESFKGGQGWGDDEWLAASPLVAKLAAPGLPRAVAVATVAGLREHARTRDLVTGPARSVWPRLQAAETVLHAALVGTPLDEAWVEEAVRRQHDEAEQRAYLAEILLDARRRREYVETVLKPRAAASRRSTSVWRETYRLLKEDWKWAGLAADEFPYDTFVSLKDAVSEGKRKDKLAGGPQVG